MEGDYTDDNLTNEEVGEIEGKQDLDDEEQQERVNEPLKGKVNKECAVCNKEGNPCGVIFTSEVSSAVEWLKEQLSELDNEFVTTDMNSAVYSLRVVSLLDIAFEDVINGG